MQTLFNPFKTLASFAALLLLAAALPGQAHALGEGKLTNGESAGGELRDAPDEEALAEDAPQTQDEDDAPADEAEPDAASDESTEADEESSEASEDADEDADEEESDDSDEEGE